MMMGSRRPHVLDANEMDTWIKTQWIEVAASDSLDRRFRKKLEVAVGRTVYRVMTKERSGTGEWCLTTETPDLKIAVEAYNGLN